LRDERTKASTARAPPPRTSRIRSPSPRFALHYGADDDAASAALLHDTVEDGGGRPMLERIRWGIGERVAAIVDGCTDAYVTPKRPWEERKQAYVARLPSLPNATKLVIACDKLDNLRATNDDLRSQGRRALREVQRAAAAPALVLQRVLPRDRGRHPVPARGTTPGRAARGRSLARLTARGRRATLAGMTAPATRPRIVVVATGGTIASQGATPTQTVGYARASHRRGALIAAVPSIATWPRCAASSCSRCCRGT
jgi:hypothetical protein